MPCELLLAGRKEGIPFLQAKLDRPDQEAAESKRILKLIADLDADAFRVRESASAELDKLGEAAVRFLKKSFQETTSPEVRRRLEVLLQKRSVEDVALTPDQLRSIRAIRIPEWSGTPEGRAVLEKLAKQSERPELSNEAREALRRVSKP